MAVWYEYPVIFVDARLTMRCTEARSVTRLGFVRDIYWVTYEISRVMEQTLRVTLGPSWGTPRQS